MQRLKFFNILARICPVSWNLEAIKKIRPFNERHIIKIIFNCVVKGWRKLAQQQQQQRYMRLMIRRRIEFRLCSSNIIKQTDLMLQIQHIVNSSNMCRLQLFDFLAREQLQWVDGIEFTQCVHS